MLRSTTQISDARIQRTRKVICTRVVEYDVSPGGMQHGRTYRRRQCPPWNTADRFDYPGRKWKLSSLRITLRRADPSGEGKRTRMRLKSPVPCRLSLCALLFLFLLLLLLQTSVYDHGPYHGRYETVVIRASVVRVHVYSSPQLKRYAFVQFNERSLRSVHHLVLACIKFL